jgi:PAS domain S-box-containing protein
MIYTSENQPEDFIYLTVNPAFDRIIGTKTVTGRRVTEVFPGIRDAYPALFEIYGRVALTGNPEAFELDFKPSAKWLRIAVYSPAREYFVAVFEDITDRKLAEESLRQTNEYLRNLLDYANAPIIVWDPGVRITRFNHAFEHLTGRTEQEVVGKDLTILFPEASRDVSLELIRKTLTGERWEVVEIPILTVSSEIRIVLWNSANIMDPEGRIISIIAQGQDITDRKLAEESLRQTNEYLRNLLDYANAPIIVWDPGFRITRFNHAFEHLTGRTEQEVVGKDLTILFPEASRDVSLELIRKTLTGERWEVVEIPILTVSSETRIVLWNSANIVDPEGRIISIIAQGQDITDRKLTEAQREALIRELEQKNAELERFTYTVSHDLKSPLITIQGFAGMVEDDARKGDPVQMKKDLLRITSAAGTMQTLLSDLLELSKVGRIVGPMEKIGMGTLAREAVSLLAIPLAEHRVTVEIAPDLPVVDVDHTRIREVFVNLIENAIKFLGDRPDPVIRIGTEWKEGIPIFFVQDNGIGINPRYLERIFNLFEKLDSGSPGTGIGLTIVRRIIEFHGGKIWAESEGPGKGTTFKFTLPGVPGKGDEIR